MNNKSFSLNLLKTFDAAARLSSFKLAANELFITPSAVSQQIKDLEKNLGIQLFDRHSQGLKLSEAGQQYWQEISPAFMAISRSTQALRMRYHDRILRVNLIPPVANRIIFPNLANFQKAYPNIKLMLDISKFNADLLHSPADLAIRFAEPPWNGCEHQKLLDIEIQPVFTYAVDKAFSLSENPKNLIHAPLIRMANTPNAWRDFFTASGLDASIIQEEFHVNDYQAAVEAVLSHGVALMLYPLEKPYVEAHQLIALPNMSWSYGAVYAVATQGRLKEESIQIFLKWLQQHLQNLN